MTPPNAIEQAIFWRDSDEVVERGCSPDWLSIPGVRAQAEKLCLGFGRAEGVPPSHFAVFAQPFQADRVAVAQVAEVAQGRLVFRLLLLPRSLYVRQIRDPFAVSDRFPPQWNASGPLPQLEWPDEPPPRRRIDDLQRILQTGNSPLLLGAVQALVDGARVVFRGNQPDPTLIRDIWSLLPESARAELWPATFVGAGSLRFDVLVSPHADSPEFDRYLREDSVIDYPEGKYEFSLQYAIEHGDQAEVDRLFGRRSSKQFLQFIVGLLLLAIGAYLGIWYLMGP